MMPASASCILSNLNRYTQQVCLARPAAVKRVEGVARSWTLTGVLATVTVHANGRSGYCCAMGNKGDGTGNGWAVGADGPERAGAARGNAGAGPGDPGAGPGDAGAGREDAGPVQSVDRAVAILEILA